ncbi:MAG: TIGR03943 family putative permease subunit [Pseudonocardiaceae bacterium]
MRRETQNVLLVLLGGALLKIAWNGTYLRYVKPSLLPFLVAAGAVILALGLIAIVRDLRAGRAHGVDFDDHGDHPDHAGRSPWLLVLPVLAIFLVSPPALGADTVARSTRAVPAPERSIDFPPLPAGPAPAMRMSDFVTRAVWDESGSLHGRQVRLVGFVVHRPGGDVYLARLVIACCAADATPTKVRLIGRDILADLPENGWFEIRGQLVPGSARADQRFVPTLTVASLRPVPPPREPYEF